MGLVIWLIPLALFGLPVSVDASNCLSFVRFPDSFPYSIQYFNLTLFISGLVAGIIWPAFFIVHPISIFVGQLIYIAPRYFIHAWPSGSTFIRGMTVILIYFAAMSIFSVIGSLVGSSIGWLARKIASKYSNKEGTVVKSINE